MSRRRFREGEAPAEPRDSFLNGRGHRGHRVSLPDAFSVSLWFRDRLRIGARWRRGGSAGASPSQGAQVVVQAV